MFGTRVEDVLISDSKVRLLCSVLRKYNGATVDSLVHNVRCGRFVAVCRSHTFSRNLYDHAEP
jgi:hypothetical protein